MKCYFSRTGILIISVVFFLSLDSEAQKRCLSTQYHEEKQQRGLQVSDRAFENWLREKRLNQQPFGTEETSRTTEDTVKIPVVVHIIHNGEKIGEGTNLSTDQIKSQIAVLNEDFQRANPDTVDTPGLFKSLAGAMTIEFVLAKSDPQGYPTNGIVRKEGAETSWPISLDEELKATSYWPAEDYLNIWVADLSPSSSLGYAQFPDIDLAGLEGEDTENRLTDGVVIDYQAFGSTTKGAFPNMRVPYDKGRTTTHEVGHFLGLRHIWGDLGGCQGNDYVDDTPTQESDYQGCPTHPSSSCSSVDMFQNYMDFTDDRCMNLFTAGQVERMMYVLDNAVRRASLKNVQGVFPPDSNFYELELLAINDPPIISCELNQYPDILIRNGGTEPINEIEMEMRINGEIYFNDVVTIDTLFSGEQMNFTFPIVSLFDGQYDIDVKIHLTNDFDVNKNNNALSKPFILDTYFEIAPYLADFNQFSLAEANWIVINDDNDITWKLVDLPDEEEANKAAFLNSFNYTSQGTQDWLISPVLDLSLTNSSSMRFDVSYAENPTFMDTLSVLVSDECGGNFKEIYRAPGKDFAATIDDDFWEPSGENDWRSINLDLNEYAGKSKVRLAFVSTNGYGNNIFIDDVNIFITPESGTVELDKNEIRAFPNPTQDNQVNVTFNLTEKQEVNLAILDTSGKTIFDDDLANVLNQTFKIDFPAVRSGVYFLRVRGRTINKVERFILVSN